MRIDTGCFESPPTSICKTLPAILTRQTILKTFDITDLEQNYWTTFQADNIDNLLSVAKTLGQIIPSRRNSADLFDTLTVKKKEDANIKSPSSMYGEKIFPFHTDGAFLSDPPKYVILRSPHSIPNCPTILCTPKFNSQDKNSLIKNVWLVNGGRGKFYTSVLEDNNNDYRIRFDLGCMRPALIDFKSSADIMDSAISSSDVQKINWKANQCVIFNNWKLLHSRADATNSSNRILQRIWINN